MMKGWFTEAITFHSVKAYLMRLCLIIFDFGSIFIAKWVPKQGEDFSSSSGAWILSTRYTSPKLPFPSTLRALKLRQSTFLLFSPTEELIVLTISELVNSRLYHSENPSTSFLIPSNVFCCKVYSFDLSSSLIYLGLL